MKIMHYKLDLEPEVAFYIRSIDYDTCFIASVNDTTGEIKLRQGTTTFAAQGTWGTNNAKRIFGWKKTDLVIVNIPIANTPPEDEQTQPLLQVTADKLIKITEREFLTSLGVICQK